MNATKGMFLSQTNDYPVLLAMHNIQTRDANEYYSETAQSLHVRNKSMHGFGFPISGDALRVWAPQEEGQNQ